MEYDGTNIKTYYGSNLIMELNSDSVSFYRKLNRMYVTSHLYTTSGIVENIAAAGTYQTVNGFSTDGLNENVTVTDSTITINTGYYGLYDIELTGNDVTHASSNTTVSFAIFVNDVIVSYIPPAERRIGTGGDVGSAGTGEGEVYLDAGDVVKAKVTATNTGNVTFGGLLLKVSRK
jgi:hypothetical protein